MRIRTSPHPLLTPHPLLAPGTEAAAGYGLRLRGQKRCVEARPGRGGMAGAPIEGEEGLT